MDEMMHGDACCDICNTKLPVEIGAKSFGINSWTGKIKGKCDCGYFLKNAIQPHISNLSICSNCAEAIDIYIDTRREMARKFKETPDDQN